MYVALTSSTTLTVLSIHTESVDLGSKGPGGTKSDKEDSAVSAVIPVMCVVDVFLSSHFSPFRGHYYLPSNFPSSTKGRDKESDDKDGDVEGEDCSSFHSVFSEDESEADRDSIKDRGGVETPRPLSQTSSRSTPASGKVAGTTPRPLGYISQRSEKGALGSAGVVEGAVPSGGSDMEGSVPTYVDLVSNSTIAPSSFSEYVNRVPPRGSSLDSSVHSAHTLSAVQQMSWRKAQPSDLDSREMLLTVDRGSALKVWSARRRELSIPVTTATRSISGAGTSCIVTGNFHTHINPDVTLIIESSLHQMLGTSGTPAESVCVCWIEHVTCPASEQRHTSREVEAAPLPRNTSRNKVAPASRSSSRDRSPNMSFADLGSSSFDLSSTHEPGVSGVWFSILAPSDYSRKGEGSDCESPFDDAATDDGDKSKGDGGVSTVQGLKYFQYRFACLSTSMETQQTQAAVWGFGPILPLGSALFPPSVTPKNLFAEVQKSFVVGRFSSSGYGFPFSLDTVTVLRDADIGEEIRREREREEDAEVLSREVRSRHENKLSCIMKITSGSSERYHGHRKEDSSTASGSKELLTYAAEALNNSPAYFTVPTKVVHNIVYNNACEVRRDDPTAPPTDHTGGIDTGLCTIPSLAHTLPFTADSLAGLAQTNLSQYDSTGRTYRTSGPALSSFSSSPFHSPSSSSSCPAIPPAMHNIEILSRLGLAEQLQQHQPLEAVTYEILPSTPQAFGLVDLAVPYGKSSRKNKSSVASANFSVVRSIVVPFDSLKGSRFQSEQGESTRGGDEELGTQVLVVLEESETHGTRLLLWTHRPEQPCRKLDTTCCLSEPVARGSPTVEQSALEPDTAAPLASEGSRYTGERGYIVEIVPDPLYGLGLRLNVKDTVTVVDSFKRHPLTDKPLPCEACLLIRPNDELISINGLDLKGSSLSSAIQAIRNVVQACGGESITLMLCRGPPRNPHALGLGRNPITDVEVEANLVASPCFFWKFLSSTDLDLECSSASCNIDQSILSVDIGYDRLANEVLLCTLSLSNGGEDSTGDARELALFRLNIKDDTRRALVQCSAVARHAMSSGEEMDRSVTLQLWRNTYPTLAPGPTRSPTAASERSVFVTLVSPGAVSSPLSSRRDGDRNKAKELALCCTLSVVEMKLCTVSDIQSLDRSSKQRVGVETTVRVVTSSTPDSAVAVSSNGASSATPSFGRYSSSREAAPATDAVKSDAGASQDSEGLGRIHLLSTPVGTAGDSQRRYPYI
jgi:hypothetical protein